MSSLDYIRIELPELYPYVMLIAGYLSFHVLMKGFGAGNNRKAFFTENEQIGA